MEWDMLYILFQDPRERVFKGFVEQLARDKGREKDMTLYNNIEKIAPKLIAKQRQKRKWRYNIYRYL